MKLLFCVALLLGASLVAGLGQGAQADQIKRRARNVADQNNARQGVPPPSQSPATSSPRPAAPTAAVTPVPLTPQQKSVASIRADLALLAATNSIDNRRRFSKTLLTAARGTGKPTGAATDQLAEDIGAALASTKLAATHMDRLAQNLEGTLNSAAMAKTQAEAIADDVKSVLEKAGVNGQRAGLVAGDLKRITTEVQKAAGK